MRDHPWSYEGLKLAMIVTRRSLLRLPVGVLDPVKLMDRSGPIDLPDHVLLDMAAEYRSLVNAQRGILANDSRDTDDIPGYINLDDRRLQLLERFSNIPARSVHGLIAKSQVILLRASSRGFHTDRLAEGLAGDVIAVTHPKDR